MAYDEELENKIENSIDKEIKEETEDYVALGFKEKTKKFLRRARFSRYISLFTIISAIFVYSLANCGWDPSKIGWGKFIANVSLLIFIAVYGMFFGEGEGATWLKNHITGLYRTTLIKFRKTISKITNRGYVDLLPDYLVWKYKKDYERECHAKLTSVRLFNNKILNLTFAQLEELKNHPIKVGENNDDFFDTISEKQYQTVCDIKNGKMFVDYIEDYNFYLMENTSNDGKQLVTKVKETNKRKEKITWQQRISRIILVTLSSIILAGFFKEALVEGNNAVSELTSRLVTLFVSIASGVNTSRLLLNEDIFVLQYKVAYNITFFSSVENKRFIATDYNKLARENYEKWEKEQEELVKQNEVVEEVVEEVKTNEEDSEIKIENTDNNDIIE